MKTSELVIFTPLPFLTHLVPAVEFAKQLINRRENLSIAFMIMKQPFDPKAQSYSKSVPTNSALQFVHLSDPNFPARIDSVSPAQYFSEVLDAQKAIVKRAAAEFIAQSESTRLAGFVIDMFCTAMIDVADDFGVPTYCFYTAGAGTLGTFHFHSLIEESNQGTTTEYDLNSDLEISMPVYTNPVPVKLLPTSFFDKQGMPWLLHHVRRLRKTKGIMINTFKELEPNALNVLLNDMNLPPIYPVGPLINLQGINRQNDQKQAIMKWLDDQPLSSVVFLSFGSAGSFKEDQVKEIAHALEQSGERFIWSFRWPPGNIRMEVSGEAENYDAVLPEGFLKRTEGIGIVTPWVPQIQVLSHSSVGGFVTHCGWSSFMEGVYCGVPMAVWPLHSDQQMTAFLLVKELKMAVEIKMDYRLDFNRTDPVIVKADEIESGIRQLMDPKSGIRQKVEEMKGKARKSVLEGGLSYTSMETVMEDIFLP